MVTLLIWNCNGKSRPSFLNDCIKLLILLCEVGLRFGSWLVRLLLREEKNLCKQLTHTHTHTHTHNTHTQTQTHTYTHTNTHTHTQSLVFISKRHRFRTIRITMGYTHFLWRPWLSNFYFSLSLSLSLSRSLTHSLARSLTHSLSLSLAHSLTLFLSPSLSLSLAHSLSLSLSLSLSQSLSLCECLLFLSLFKSSLFDLHQPLGIENRFPLQSVWSFFFFFCSLSVITRSPHKTAISSWRHPCKKTYLLFYYTTQFICRYWFKLYFCNSCCRH